MYDKLPSSNGKSAIIKKKIMLKTKNNLLLIGIASLSFVFAFTLAANIKAANISGNSGKNQVNSANAKKNQNQDKNTTEVKGNDENTGEGTTSAEQEQERNREKNQESFGQTNANAHRSVVANFVKSLLEVARNEDNDGNKGIGDQVREIAQQQNQDETATVTSMESVESRGKIKTFLFGSDYKNLGALRSEMVQTRNRIAQLTRLMQKTENADDKAVLQKQISQLNQEQAKINDFITTNENKISLFGWLFKLFGTSS